MNSENKIFHFTTDFYADIREKSAGKINISAKIILKAGLKIKYNFNTTFQMKQLLRVNTVCNVSKVKIQLYIHTCSLRVKRHCHSFYCFSGKYSCGFD